MNKNERYNLYRNSVYPGWWGILDKYIPQILAMAPDAELYIKEKYGLLRIDVSSETVNWSTFLEMKYEAEEASATVCEVCGAPGKLRTERDWLQTLCDRCNNADEETKRNIIEEAEKQWLAKE